VAHEPCKEVATRFLTDTLASIWEDKLGIGAGQRLEEDVFAEANLAAVPFFTVPGPQGTPTTLDEQLPHKAVAVEWLNTFLQGPNTMFRICDEAETWRLLDLLYAREHIEIGSRCSIWFQLATGCRFTAGTLETSHVTLFESGCEYLEQCIEQAEEVSPLWIVSPMLLSCLYLLDSRPKSCWITLGGVVRLLQAHHLDLARDCCPGLSNNEYKRWREVWRAALSFDTYEISYLSM
jgi:hypothetical protein